MTTAIIIAAWILSLLAAYATGRLVERLRQDREEDGWLKIRRERK